MRTGAEDKIACHHAQDGPRAVIINHNWWGQDRTWMR